MNREQERGQEQQVVVMDHESLSNLTSASGEASASISSTHEPNQSKRKRNLPGNPDPDSEVIALSPKSLMATNRFMCEICNKGFQRDQNLQLHRRGHNLPWKLKQRSSKEVVRKKVYVCPEINCVHHEPSRALGDLTGIKKHFCRKHGEKKWKCDKCSKRYAVQSDWKAHSKICGTREYRCDCGTIFSRRDSFITHRAFCDALAEETGRSISTNPLLLPSQHQHKPHHHQPPSPDNNHTSMFNLSNSHLIINTTNDHDHDHQSPFAIKQEPRHEKQQPQSFNLIPPWLQPPPSSSPIMFSQDFSQTPHVHPKNPSHGSCFGSMSATALLQKATQTGSATGFGPNPSPHEDQMGSSMLLDMMMMNSFPSFDGENPFSSNGNDGLTRDFLGLRPLSQSDILSLAGLANGSSSSTPQEDDRHGKSWQGQL